MVQISGVNINADPNEPQINSPRHESNVILSSVPSALTDEMMVPRLVASVQVAMYIMKEEPRIKSMISKESHSAVNAEELSQRWSIGLETARKTLKVTTQVGIRHTLHPLRRHYRTDHMALRYCRLRTTFYTHTLFSKVTSIKGNKCAQIFCSGNYLKVHPMVSKSQVGIALQDFANDVGVMDELVVNSVAEQTGPKSEFTKTVRHL